MFLSSHTSEKYLSLSLPRPSRLSHLRQQAELLLFLTFLSLLPPPLTKHFDPSSDPAQTRRELYSPSAATDVRRQSLKTAPNPSCDPQ